MTLLLAYHFDEASGATVLDRSGNGRDLTISGIGVRTASGNGHTDRGLTATGGGQLVGPSPTGMQTAQRTIECWVKNTSAVIGHVVEFYVGSLDSSAWSILFLSGQIHIQARNSSGFVRASASWTPSSTWHHIAGTYDGTNIRLYIDGVLQGSPVALTSPMRTDATEFRILDNSDSATVIDDVRIYDVALSQAEIASDMATPVPDAPAVNQGTLTGSFSSPTLDGTVTATAEVSIDGTFAAPVTVFDARGSANGELTAAFSSPTIDLTGGSIPPEPGMLNGDFSGPITTFVGTARAAGQLAGTFSSPTFVATGGEPQNDRDILFTIEPGTRPGTSIAVGPPRTIVAQGATQRSQIGAGHMNKTWRNGSKEYIDFRVTLEDPEGELTLVEAQAIPFWVVVTNSTETPDRDDDDWVSIDPEVTAVDDAFAADILYMYEATVKGLHSVWVKFGPTPEEPIFLAASFVAL